MWTKEDRPDEAIPTRRWPVVSHGGKKLDGGLRPVVSRAIRKGTSVV